jgi:hypothetical protein
MLSWADPSTVDVGALSQVLGVAGGWFVAVLLLFGGGGWLIYAMATDRLVTGRRLRALQRAHDAEQKRGDVLARTLLELQPGVKLAVSAVERFSTLTVDGGEPPAERRGITA